MFNTFGYKINTFNRFKDRYYIGSDFGYILRSINTNQLNFEIVSTDLCYNESIRYLVVSDNKEYILAISDTMIFRSEDGIRWDKYYVFNTDVTIIKCVEHRNILYVLYIKDNVTNVCYIDMSKEESSIIDTGIINVNDIFRKNYKNDLYFLKDESIICYDITNGSNPIFYEYKFDIRTNDKLRFMHALIDKNKIYLSTIDNMLYLSDISNDGTIIINEKNLVSKIRDYDAYVLDFLYIDYIDIVFVVTSRFLGLIINGDLRIHSSNINIRNIKQGLKSDQKLNIDNTLFREIVNNISPISNKNPLLNFPITSFLYDDINETIFLGSINGNIIVLNEKGSILYRNIISVTIPDDIMPNEILNIQQNIYNSTIWELNDDVYVVSICETILYPLYKSIRKVVYYNILDNIMSVQEISEVSGICDVDEIFIDSYNKLNIITVNKIIIMDSINHISNVIKKDEKYSYLVNECLLEKGSSGYKELTIHKIENNLLELIENSNSLCKEDKSVIINNINKNMIPLKKITLKDKTYVQYDTFITVISENNKLENVISMGFSTIKDIILIQDQILMYNDMYFRLIDPLTNKTKNAIGKNNIRQSFKSTLNSVHLTSASNKFLDNKNIIIDTDSSLYPFIIKSENLII